MDKPNLNDYYTMSEAAEVMGCTYQTFSLWKYSDLRGPKIPEAIRIGASKFYRKVEIHRCLRDWDPERHAELFSQIADA